MTTSRASRVIRASRERLYRAFVDADELIRWLPPAGMHGRLHRFDAREGGGYRLSLSYDGSDPALRGKTDASIDTVEVRFEELKPPERILQTAVFESADPAFAGEMRMITTFTEVLGGAEVVMTFENLPPGVRPEDNDMGARSSLENLAALVEG